MVQVSGVTEVFVCVPMSVYVCVCAYIHVPQSSNFLYKFGLCSLSFLCAPGLYHIKTPTKTERIVHQTHKCSVSTDLRDRGLDCVRHKMTQGT